MVRETLPKIQSTDRRGLLKALGATSVWASFPKDFAGVASATESGETELLGGFESGYDGWKTNGGNEFHLVDENSFAPGVTQGTQALGVHISGDPFPHVWKTDVRNVDFRAHPYLVGSVIATTFDNDANVVFKLRYYYGQTGGEKGGEEDDEKSGKQQDGGDSGPAGKPNVVESPEIQVEQLTPSTLYWDMSELSDDTLDDPTRLEIAWYPADHPPETGANGRGSASSYDYRGGVVFDNIRVTSNPTEGAADAMKRTFDRLQSTHGPFEEAVTEQVEASEEHGYALFSDGTRISYTFEDRGDHKFVYTLDGDSFKLGGGW